MRVQLQYVQDCPNAPVADERLRRALDAVGLDDVTVQHVLVSEPTGFHGSPTILIDDVDPFPGEPVGQSCRLYRNDQGLAGAPTQAQLVSALRSRSRG